jgi:hypothetical protein
MPSVFLLRSLTDSFPAFWDSKQDFTRQNRDPIHVDGGDPGSVKRRVGTIREKVPQGPFSQLAGLSGMLHFSENQSLM